MHAERISNTHFSDIDNDELKVTLSVPVTVNCIRNLEFSKNSNRLSFC